MPDSPGAYLDRPHHITPGFRWRLGSVGVVKNPGLVRDVALYSVARLALVGVVALGLVLVDVPLLVAVVFALVIALPLAVVVLRPLRVRVAAGMAAAGARRRAERARLREQLRGGERVGEP
ncbi:MAG: DUF4229 domain-containing protein [Pseudonocardiaceae bacterium]